MTLVNRDRSPKLPPGTKLPPIFEAIEAILDQFGTLERFQRKYGEIFYAPKSAIFPAYAIFSNPQAIEKVFTADPDLFEMDRQSNAAVKILNLLKWQNYPILVR